MARLPQDSDTSGNGGASCERSIAHCCGVSTRLRFDSVADGLCFDCAGAVADSYDLWSTDRGFGSDNDLWYRFWWLGVGFQFPLVIKWMSLRW